MDNWPELQEDWRIGGGFPIAVYSELFLLYLCCVLVSLHKSLRNSLVLMCLFGYYSKCSLFPPVWRLTFFSHIFGLSLEINLFFPYKIVPTLDCFLPPTQAHLHLFLSDFTLCPNCCTYRHKLMLLIWTHPCTVFLLYPKLWCDNHKHVPPYKIGVFQKILLE